LKLTKKVLFVDEKIGAHFSSRETSGEIEKSSEMASAV
jgi:hypothetical protein